MQNFPALLEKALKPLEDLGMSQDEAKLVGASFEELTRAVFEARVEQVFSEGDRGDFNKQEGTLDPAGAISKLEEEYEKKTGKNFLDLYAEVFEDVVAMAAKAGRDGLENYKRLVQLGPDQVKRFVTAVEKRDDQAVKEILEKLS